MCHFLLALFLCSSIKAKFVFVLKENLGLKSSFNLTDMFVRTVSKIKIFELCRQSSELNLKENLCRELKIRVIERRQ